MLLKTENLVKDYYAGKETIRALRGIDLKVDEGNFLVISGPSGSGKTTLLNLIGCIDKPTAGEVYFCLLTRMLSTRCCFWGSVAESGIVG